MSNIFILNLKRHALYNNVCMTYLLTVVVKMKLLLLLRCVCWDRHKWTDAWLGDRLSLYTVKTHRAIGAQIVFRFRPNRINASIWHVISCDNSIVGPRMIFCSFNQWDILCFLNSPHTHTHTWDTWFHYKCNWILAKVIVNVWWQ